MPALTYPTGLSIEEASTKLTQHGYNELPSQKSKNIFLLLFSVLTEPMLLLLIACGVIYLIWGEMQDAILLGFGVLVVVGITFYQERKTEKTLEALRNLSSPRALVIRNSEKKRIPGREVVPDDIILLNEGDRIPADAVIITCQNLSVDESLLTGESNAVRKNEWNGKDQPSTPGGDDLPFIYSGTLVVHGRGMAKVTSTGISTQMGKIGKALETIKEEDTLLHKETSKMVKYFTLEGLLLCVILTILVYLSKGNFLSGFLAGLTLSMSVLPEEFPVVLIIFLTLGAWRISKHQVLARRSAVIETLGAATVLCVDKTGTITENKMHLAEACIKGHYFQFKAKNEKSLIDKATQELLNYACLASEKDPYDPIEKELKRTTLQYSSIDPLEKLNLIKAYPITKNLFAVTEVWQENDNIFVATKGAPETIMEMCGIKGNEKINLEEEIIKMSKDGLRIIAVAKGEPQKPLPDNQRDFKFTFLGLLGFSDPIRTTVPEAVKTAYSAGMRIIMITGDYPGTASNIAAQIGLKNPELCITGKELSSMDEENLQEKIKNISVFARVIPEQKLLIINALKKNGEIVAMTGDGVNDAPALKAAHIGISMGERGTDVAREASSLVLLNDDFTSIVVAVRLGRRIFDNIKRAVRYIISIHVPIAGMSLLPLIFNLPMVLMPAHIAFLELIIDPASSVVFETIEEDDSIMKRPPRGLKEPIFNKRIFSVSLLQGGWVLLMVFGVFLYAIVTGRSEDEARSFAFTALILSNLILVTANITWSKSIIQIILTGNRTLYIVISAALTGLISVLSLPFTQKLFHLAPLRISDFIIILVLALITLLWFELLKKLQKNYFPPKYPLIS
jgi:Ca2+-transporting ATPase